MSTELPNGAGVRRPPTMRDVADHVGVSRQLVSMVLRGVEGPSAESRERILAASRELGQPHAGSGTIAAARIHSPATA